MLADGLVFMCQEEMDTAHLVISHNANQVSERMHSWFRVAEHLHKDICLSFDWLQSVNP